MIFDKKTADRLVLSLMNILDRTDYSDENLSETKPDNGIAVLATAEAIEALKQSDSPFAGFVISCLVEPEESENQYNDWMRKTLNRTIDNQSE